MIKDMIVKSVRYFETNRGLGYEAKTNEGSIWNDGNGKLLLILNHYIQSTIRKTLLIFQNQI